MTQLKTRDLPEDPFPQQETDQNQKNNEDQMSQ